MKPTSVALLSAVGMVLTSVTVYSLTPPGGVHIRADVTPESTSTVAGTDDVTELAHFQTGKTLMIEGRLGEDKLVRGAGGDEFVLLELKGADIEAPASAPVNLSLVIDRSGSMKGARLQNAVNAATGAVSRLHDGDIVSVVSFDTQPIVVVPPTPIGPSVRERINADIRGITLGGDTCISCGIEQAERLLQQTTGKVNKMIVLSDGDANHGVRDVPGFRALAQRARERGVPITTVGVDVDYNEKIMSAIAQESNGRHYFVENETGLERVFEGEAESLTQTIAADTEVSIDLAPGVELDRVFDRSFRRSGTRVVVPVGSFARGETKSVLLKVRVPTSGDAVTAVADVGLSFRDVVAATQGSCSGKLAAKLVDKPSDVSPIDPIVENRVQRSETATALKEANTLFEQGKADEARRRLAREVSNVTAAQAKVAAAPTPRKAALDRDFEKQNAALNEASSGFATPPPAPVAGAAPVPAQASRPGRAAVKRNLERSDAFGF